MEENNVQAEEAKKTVVSAEDKAKMQKNIKFFLTGFGALLLLALVVALTVGTYRVYAKTSTDSFTVGLAKVLRLPALKINGESVSYSDYASDMKAITIMREYDRANNGPSASLTDEQMSDQVLWRLVNNVLLKGASQKYNVQVEQSEVDALKSQILQQFKSTDEVDKELMTRYGWNFSTYEQKVIRPFVMQNKLTEKFQSDEAGRAEVKKKAEAVLAEIKNGADFAATAKKYSEDSTAAAGGELGWFAKGEMVQPFEDAAFSLEKGKISDLVETTFGYHIIQTEDKKTETVKDANGKNVKSETVQARHILLRFPSLGAYLDNQAKAATIHLYLKAHNPFEALKQ